ncbi:MAG: carboxypeptidase-like regulatory domain-containing protein [Flavobacterium sp.]|nr:MAG: carboxypeptidase-like regulatory domain-containing protein [Flavobacterium sp.]
MKNFIFLIIALACSRSFGQTTVKVIDRSTGESIPYANILCNQTESLMSNAEGFFTVPEKNSADDVTLAVSYIGYAPVQTTLGQLRATQMTILLQPSVYELDQVDVGKLPSANAIMASVRKYLQQNYAGGGKISQNSVFLRESNYIIPKKFDFEIDESTGFTKNNLKAANAEMSTFTSRIISNPPREYVDMLCRYYSPGKAAAPGKLEVIKATKLKDENRAVSLEGLQGSFTKLLLKHLDTTKFYKVRSGWFGSNDTVSLRKDFKSSKKKPANSEVTSAKSRLASVYEKNSFLSKDFQFIHEPDLYNYKYEGAVLLTDGNLAYVISFSPDRNKADYKGKLVISASDFGIVRADYELDEGKTLDGVNLKLLLGIKVSDNLRKGTIIYRQNPSGEGYYLQYASREAGQYIYVHRPVKFVELSKSEKDVVEFDVKIEGNLFGKTEYLNLSQKEIAEGDYEKISEPDFKYIKIKQYDPLIWKDYSAIEPLQEMKRYKLEGEQ